MNSNIAPHSCNTLRTTFCSIPRTNTYTSTIFPLLTMYVNSSPIQKTASSISPYELHHDQKLIRRSSPSKSRMKYHFTISIVISSPRPCIHESYPTMISSSNQLETITSKISLKSTRTTCWTMIPHIIYSLNLMLLPQ